MPESIRKIFIANNYIVNYRITSNGYFEARIRRKGMYIEASGRDFETMRKRFMDRLAAFYERPPVQPAETPAAVPTAKAILFGDYGREWLKIKEQTTKPSTFKEYERSFRVDLEPTFGSKPLADITRNDLQTYLFGIVGANQPPQGGETRAHAELHLRYGGRGLRYPLSHEKGRTARLPNQEGRSAYQRRRGKARQLLQGAQERRRYGRFACASLFRPKKIRAEKHFDH